MKSIIVSILNKLLGQRKIIIDSFVIVNKVLIIRQHNQFGDLLASSALFVALKEKYPNCEINVLVSPANFYAIQKNNYIENYFIFDKKKIFNLRYFYSLKQFLSKNYDLCIVPSTVSLSFTSSLLGRFSNAKLTLGVESLNGKENKYSQLFNVTVPLDWRKNPDQHVADFGLEIVKPFGIKTTKFAPVISFDKEDAEYAKTFVNEMGKDNSTLLIGLHVGAGKPKNRWSLDKYIAVVNYLNTNYKAKFYFTGSIADKNEIDYIKQNIKFSVFYFLDKEISKLAALISITDLFITNDTGVMHVAGSTKANQISIFGPTNPYNWAPVGDNKYFCKNKSELIDDVTYEEVIALCNNILKNKK